MSDPIYSGSGETTTYQFKLEWLLPTYWHIWMALGLWLSFSTLPHTIKDKVINMISQLLRYRDDKKKPNQVRINIANCFPYLSKRKRNTIVNNYYNSVVRAMFDYSKFLLTKDSLVNHVRLKNVKIIDQALGQGYGVNIFTFHTVSCDFSGFLFRYIDAEAIGIYRPIKNKLVQWIHNKLRVHNTNLKMYSRDDKFTFLAASKTIKRGGIFLVLIDEALTTSRNVSAPFFSQNKQSLTWTHIFTKIPKVKTFFSFVSYNAKIRKYEISYFEFHKKSFNNKYEQAAATNLVLQNLTIKHPDSLLWKLHFFQHRSID